MEEFSNAVVEERDRVTEKLRMKESEIEQERVLREELNERLKELQNKVIQFFNLFNIKVCFIFSLSYSYLPSTLFEF